MQIQPSSGLPQGTGQPAISAERSTSRGREVSNTAPSVASDLVRNSDSAADAEQVKRAADEINRQLKDAAQSIRFSVDSGSGKTIVRVVDSETGDVIRQIPSEEVLAISRSIERMQGVLLHQKA